MMDTLIKQELNHAIWYDANTDQLINLYFWDVVTNDILAKNEMIMKWQGTWCKPAKVKPSSTPNTANTTPEKPPTPEHKISVWLTQVCHELAQQIDPSNPPRAHVWNSDGSQRCIDGSLTRHKPDIILMNAFGKPDEHPHWEDVHAIVEITSSLKGFTTTIKNTLYSKAFMMFQAQHNHHFILAVTICQSKAYFNVFDRAGMVHSVALDMITERTKFLRILAGLAFSNKANIGYDPSITRNGDRAMISCSRHKFVIVATVFANSTIR